MPGGLPGGGGMGGFGIDRYISLTVGYPGTLQLLVISACFSSKREPFSNVFSGEIGP